MSDGDRWLCMELPVPSTYGASAMVKRTDFSVEPGNRQISCCYHCSVPRLKRELFSRRTRVQPLNGCSQIGKANSMCVVFSHEIMQRTGLQRTGLLRQARYQSGSVLLTRCCCGDQTRSRVRSSFATVNLMKVGYSLVYLYTCALALNRKYLL